MTNREKFIKALKREPITGHVPHFELVFFLTMEAFGKVHPMQRHYGQWDQMSKTEQNLHINEMANLYIDTAKKYHHSAIFVLPNPNDLKNTIILLERIREISGDEYFILLHGDPTFSIPDGSSMVDFSMKMMEEPEVLLEEAKRRNQEMVEYAEAFSKRPGLLDGFGLCSDYCFNTNPFMSPEMFGVFVTPYLKEIIAEYRKLGFYSIKHTDGNIMPILDQIAECEPDALHSIDPQAGVSLAEVKKLYGHKMCMIGNVNCGLLQTGTDEEVIQDVNRSLADGMPGYGYIFSTSNCAYTGLALRRYEMMHDIWYENGIYDSEV